MVAGPRVKHPVKSRYYLNPAQNIAWNPAINESRPEDTPAQINRGFPRMVGPVLWCHVGVEFRVKHGVDEVP